MSASKPTLSRKVRFAISILVIGHLLAVITPPLSFQTRGPLGLSPAVGMALAPVEGYGQFLYIDRGYAFFAPDPGPSHLFQAAITAKDGQRVQQMFPDHDKHWPRLLYHRHFMLSEFLDEIYQPPGPPRELLSIDREGAEYWIRARARYEHVRQSVVDHLRHEYPGQDVAIRRVEHLIPDLVEFQRAPIALDDPELYRVILDQPIDTGDDGATLRAPTGPPETVAPPSGSIDAADEPSDKSLTNPPSETSEATEKTEPTKTDSKDDDNQADDAPSDQETAAENAEVA